MLNAFCILHCSSRGVFLTNQRRNLNRCKRLFHVQFVFHNHFPGLFQALLRRGMAPEINLQSLNCDLAEFVKPSSSIMAMSPVVYHPSRSTSADMGVSISIVRITAAF